MKCILLFLMGISLNLTCFSQDHQDPEFTKGYIFPVGLKTGLVTTFNKKPELFIGSVFLNPQWIVKRNVLRVGPDLSLAYSSNNISALMGVTAAVKIKTLGGLLGSYANIYLQPSAQWGTAKQQLIGLAVGAEVFKLIHVQLKCDRDYHFNNWQFQSGVAINIFKTKEKFD
ncbi:MAG: hypothetical protein E6Q95_03460 [Chitinophagaceae bacterium]|nr:MAG: hypothetical protein E6Q95_03460 [Chitinophagaceae bacterium]